VEGEIGVLETTVDTGRLLFILGRSEDVGRSVRKFGVTIVEFVITAFSAFEEILTVVIDECVNFVRSVVSVVPLCDNRNDVGNESNEDDGTDGDDVGKEGDDFDDVDNLSDFVAFEYDIISGT